MNKYGKYLYFSTVNEVTLSNERHKRTKQQT